jgi:energy-coupling factor transporter ATP-binding protein EcfA2
MPEEGFPRGILSLPVVDRVDYFSEFIMSHPILKMVFDDLMLQLYQAGGPSLIFLLGPTGVGKSTLLARLVKKVLEKTLEKMQANPGYIPIAGILAISPEFSQFDWYDFYSRGLKALKDPFIEKEEKRRPTKRNLRSAFESALKNRNLDFFYVDEAHNFCKVPTGKRLVDQTDCLKSISNCSQVTMLLTSTYQAGTLLNLNDQLCRRSATIHFPRYCIGTKQQQKVFRSVIQNLSLHLPLPETPNFSERWDYLYERSCGCFGTMKDWFTRTLGAVLEKNPQAHTILFEDLEKYALPASQCKVIMKAILEGEMMMKENEEDIKTLRQGLGLPDKAGSANTASDGGNAGKEKNSKSKHKDVGKPKPRSYPVGKTDYENESLPSDEAV